MIRIWKAGLGLIQSPSTEHLRTGELVEVLPRLRAKPMPVSVLYPHRRQVPARVRAFIECLEKTLTLGSR